MKPSTAELEELRSDALESDAFRASMHESAGRVDRWNRDHPTSPTDLLHAIEHLTRLFPALSPDLSPTRGESFPLL